MYRPPAGHGPRPPSPPRQRQTHHTLSIRTTMQPTQTHHTLSIRTTMQPTQISTLQGQSSSPPNISYPIPISQEKFSKALRLYKLYRVEEGLAQRAHQEPPSATDASRLNIPGPMTAQSLTSHTSSRAYTPSVSTSTYEALTELSSVVSFTDNESPLSATANASTELRSYNGEKVKQRVRRPLSPRSKAKAALIRHLGSCKSCRSRRVPCPLDHHDIRSLEKARQVRAHKQRGQSQQQQQSISSITTSSHGPSGITSAEQHASGGSQGQTRTLFGLGQNEQLLHTFSANTTPTDPNAPVYPDPLAEIQPRAYQDIPSVLDLSVPLVNTDPYATYQDGQMIALGVLRGSYFCQHLDGLCQQSFQDEEALQMHFETTHFAFTRIYPAHRYLCYSCQCLNNFPTGRCSSCGIEGQIEVWIYGNYIRTPNHHRIAPDEQDLLRKGSSSNPFFAFAFGFGDMDQQFGGDLDNGDNFNGNMNQGGFYSQSDNAYTDHDSQGDGGNGYDTPQSGGYPFHGNYFRENRHEASSVTVRKRNMEALQKHCRLNFILLTLALLVAITFLFQTHSWFLRMARLSSLPSYPDLPIIGFLVVLASFAMSYTYSSLKDSGASRIQRPQCRPRRCPLNDLPRFTVHCMHTAPDIYIREAVFL